MPAIQISELPTNALLQRYAQRVDCYTDCFACEVAGEVGFAEFVQAFYTTPLFRLERIILKYAVSRPSTDDEAAAFANGTGERFAAWDVEAQDTNQLLACDMAQRTRSWFMTEVVGQSTKLYFGSAVTPVVNKRTGVSGLGFGFRALIGVHKLYSRSLLWSARRRLNSMRS